MPRVLKLVYLTSLLLVGLLCIMFAPDVGEQFYWFLYNGMPAYSGEGKVLYMILQLFSLIMPLFVCVGSVVVPGYSLWRAWVHRSSTILFQSAEPYVAALWTLGGLTLGVFLSKVMSLWIEHIVVSTVLQLLPTFLFVLSLAPFALLAYRLRNSQPQGRGCV